MPPEIKSRLAGMIDSLRPGVPDARWVPANNLHLTLAFLGAVAPSRVPDLVQALGAAVSGLAGFPLMLDGVGAFPNEDRARVVWVGLTDAAGGLGLLVGAVREGLRPLGFDDDDRPFRAHITLARIRRPSRVTLTESFEAVRFVADRITLFESHLGGGGPRYDATAVFPFRGRVSDG